MTITLQQTEKILKGQHKFSQLGFSMLVTRLKTLYAKMPTPSTLAQCAGEINTFLGKYHTVMAADMAIIKNL